MAAWGSSKSEWESLKVAAWESSDADAKDDACEPDTQVGTYAGGVNLAIERFFDEDSQLQFAIVLNTFVKVASSLSFLSLSLSLSLSMSLSLSLLNHSTTQLFNPFNLSTLPPFNFSSLQPFNPSTPQPCNPSSPSALQALNPSTLQLFSPSTLQPCRPPSI